jgi:hypothetical protein
VLGPTERWLVVVINDKRSQLGHALLSEVVCLLVCGRTLRVAVAVALVFIIIFGPHTPNLLLLFHLLRVVHRT